LKRVLATEITENTEGLPRRLSPCQKRNSDGIKADERDEDEVITILYILLILSVCGSARVLKMFLRRKLMSYMALHEPLCALCG